MISYIVKFSADPYNPKSGIPQWWPNYICEKELTEKQTIDEDKEVYTMIFRFSEQYLQEFDDYVNTQLKNYIAEIK